MAPKICSASLATMKDCSLANVFAIAVSVAVLTLDAEQPSRDTFAWTVLTALAGEVDSSVDADNRVTLSLRKRRGDLSPDGAGTASS